MKIVHIASWPLSVALSASLGLLSVCAPVWLYQHPLQPAPISPLVRTGIEKLGITTLLFLLLSGLLVGGLFSFQRSAAGLQPALLGVAALVPFPVLALAEIAKDPHTHNLLPFELAVYAFLALFTGGGALAGRALAAYCIRSARGRMGRVSVPPGKSVPR